MRLILFLQKPYKDLSIEFALKVMNATISILKFWEVLLLQCAWIVGEYVPPHSRSMDEDETCFNQ